MATESDSMPNDALNAKSGNESTSKKKSGSGKMKIFAILAVVMIAEAGMIYWLVPSSGSSNASAEGGDPALATIGGEGNGKETVEVDIAPFNVTNNRAAQSSSVHVRFRLVAIVADSQQFAFKDAALQHHEARVKQAVIKVVRSSSLEDLNDPNLSTIKRLIREEINKVLQQSYISEIVISDFTTMEQ